MTIGRHLLFTILFFVSFLCPGTVYAVGLAVPAETAGTNIPKTWIIKYGIVGGLAGRNEHLVLQQDGEVEVSGGRGSKSNFKISAEQLAKITVILQRLNFSALSPPAKPRTDIPDYGYSPLTITYDGHEYGLVPDNQALAAELQPIMTEGLKRAEDEKWIKAGPFRPGKVWKVSEEVRDNQGMWHGELWLGTWTRRGDTNIFDAVWRNNKSNQELSGTVILDSVERGKIAMHRTSSNVSYDGWYSPERQNEITGYVRPLGNKTWRVTISY